MFFYLTEQRNYRVFCAFYEIYDSQILVDTFLSDLLEIFSVQRLESSECVHREVKCCWFHMLN